MIRVRRLPEASQVVRFRLARALFGRPLYYTAAYWVDGLLIDTGCAHTARQLTSVLKGWRVDRVVNTHAHEDHIGGNAQVQGLFNCPILAHPEALPIVANPKLQPLQLYRRLSWGQPKPARAEPIGDWIETDHFRFQVIHTPGHSPSHVCLFEPGQGWLFSGDAYMGGEDRALRQAYDIHGIIASLEKLAELPVRTIFSGSGTVRSEGTKPLQDKIAYLKKLGERIHALHREGLSARQIRRRLFGRELPITFLTFGHFSGLHLVKSYLAGFASPGETIEPATILDDGELTQEDKQGPLTKDENNE